MRKRSYAVLVTLVLCLATTGCGLGRPDGSSKVPTVSASPDVVAASPVEAPEAPVTTAPPEEQDPAIAAQRFLLIWARPSTPYSTWWPAVAPLMNPQGQQAYAATDPAALPVLTLTGPPTTARSDIPTSAMVWQPTSRGRFGVRLTRTSPTAAWLVAELRFPAGLH